MRISNNIMYSDFIKNLGTNSSKVQKTMNQLSSFKEVSKSSDNPLLVSKIMGLNVALDQNQMYSKTINDAISWTQVQDSALNDAGTTMLRIRTLVQSSATATAGTDEVKANKDEIQQSISELVDTLNTNFDGRYIFGGSNTNTPPYVVKKNSDGDITGIDYQGTDQNLPREISEGVSVDLLSNGNNLMNTHDKTTGKDDNLGTYFNDLVSALNSDDKTQLSGDLLSRFDNLSDNITSVRSQVGALENRLSAAQSRNSTETLNLKEEISDKQDVDVASKYMEYQNQMTAYQATIAMGTKIMQTTVLNYLD
ncbi:flagellar hook-associated protein FlgL [Liquorilactobacillus hordei]|uniref:Flagellar hook-associated protein 3 FlgL n=2 Tax=Liquorilactobacillus hordei TaxID=468911 RepID=A0A0A7RFK4_9LACO|nr:flagellar hook-associated protein FlgL [Liquorilactobacillus hordei]AJA34022.1 flagellar hook-associated protein 3 FlgL [Liquorilactobacillus hordei]KRL02652.1 flagellar hook associated protein [Liquorilactobacillus hordei DSM 19519]QYH51315.1 flagellar hook-associated protein 3 [Liquorilactobacillus hordei DSM 19519]